MINLKKGKGGGGAKSIHVVITPKKNAYCQVIRIRIILFIIFSISQQMSKVRNTGDNNSTKLKKS